MVVAAAAKSQPFRHLLPPEVAATRPPRGIDAHGPGPVRSEASVRATAIMMTPEWQEIISGFGWIMLSDIQNLFHGSFVPT